MLGILPAYNSRLLLIDAGSNTNCKPINLLQFAQMSTIYIRNTYNIKNPTVGLLNIGTEENKGNELTKESYKLLKEKSPELGLNFVRKCRRKRCFFWRIGYISYRWLYWKCIPEGGRRTRKICKKITIR